MTNPHILKLMNFLRDFADANADSFAPEQIDYLNQAAVAIVILDKAVNDLVKERDDAYAQIDRYKNGYEGGCHACEVVAVRNQELLAERDGARREICVNATKEPYRQMCGSGILLPQDAARERGWDCFKGDSDAQTNP